MAGLEESKKRNPGSSQRVSRFSEILGAAKSDSQITGYPDTQQPTKPAKAKRNNPDYTQVSFRIPKKLSRELDRAILDLDDAEIQLDRSDLLEAIAGAFLRVAEERGTAEALEVFKNLGTQISE